jgi:hypothetical protein
MDVASNPTPVGIGIAIMKQIVKKDMIADVEAQLSNMREHQIYAEDMNAEQMKRQIASVEAGNQNLEELTSRQMIELEINIQKQKARDKVLNNGFEQRMSSRMSVLTSSRIEMPKLQVDNTRMQNLRNDKSKYIAKKLTNIDKLNTVLTDITKFVSNGNVRYVGEYMGIKIFETKYCKNGNAITLPPLGIFVTPNESEKERQDTLRHEHGHILQSYLLGIIGFYTWIGVPSFISTQIATTSRQTY